MKKKVVILILFIFGLIIYIIPFKTEKEQGLQKNMATYYKKDAVKKTLKLSKKERASAGIPPNKYLEQQYLLEINPHTGRTHPENIYKIQQELKIHRLVQRRTPGDGIDNQWVERGPNNVGGRTRVVLFDPNDNTNKRVFAGGVSGGLWVNDDITDANSSWSSVGIDENLSVTCIAVDPNNSQIMYLGTGEFYSPQSAIGNGIWKTIDGGTTWESVYKLRGTTTISSTIEVPGTYFMTDIIVRDKDGSSLTTNDSEVFASIGGNFYSSNPINTYVGRDNYGIFKSTDEGANWLKVTLNLNTDGSGTSVAPNDFEIGADNTLWLGTTRDIDGEGGGRIYSSTDGTTFSLKHTIPDGKRTEIAVSKTNANTIYVLGDVKTYDGSNQLIAPFVTLLKTTDGFATAPISPSIPVDADSGIPADDFTNLQAFYDLVIEVDPNNDAILYVGGIDLFRSTDSGTSWEQISTRSTAANLSGTPVSYVHADQHSWAFHPTDSNISLIGNDGGVFYANSLSTASSSATAIEERNKNYNTTQFYHAAISQTTDPEYVIGGAQDNGILFFDEATSGTNSAIKVSRGDGTHCFIDKEGGYMIVAKLYNNIYRYNLPYTGSAVTISSDSNTGRFFNAMALDENLDILYSNGDDHLARFTNIASGSLLRSNITDPLLTNISAIKVSPFTTTSSKVYIGTRAGKLIKVENANTETQTVTDISSSSFLGNISSVNFGASENEIMVTFYTFGVESIWFTTDGGANWNNKEGDFPDINVRCILMNPLNENEVIVGSELGVWNTTNFRDASPNWNQSYNGMSDATVTSFSLRTIDNTVLAATYGRGMFTSKFAGNVLTTWTGAVDSDWVEPGNWSNGLPTSIMDVKIPDTTNQPIINSSVTIQNVSIESGSSLAINAQGSITIEENLTNSGNLIINSSSSNSGSLIVEGNSTGNITYNRSVTDSWHLTSSPVIGQNYNNDWVSENSIASGIVNTSLRGIASYNNDSGGWSYMLAGDDYPFVQGSGYSTKRTATGNLSYTGTILTTGTTKAISKGTSNAFNLIGNVYTSHIPLNNGADNANNFLVTNTSLLEEATIWLWDGTSYVTVNHAKPSQFLAPGQGFFVKSTLTGGLVSFTALMQNHQTVNFLKKQQLRPEIKLILNKGKDEKTADVYYIEGTTEGFDNGYDSSIYSGVSKDFEIYTKLVNKEIDMNLSIQSIPVDYSIIVPIGIIAEANTDMSIRIEAKNIDKGKKVYLEDKKRSVFTMIDNDETSYSFRSEEAENGSGRFYLHTSSKVLDIQKTQLTDRTIFYAKDKIHFSGLPSGKKSFKIYNTIGQLLLKENIDLEHSISVDKLPKAVYIVEIETEEGIIKKKIMLK
jgi:hypothetical protein